MMNNLPQSLDELIGLINAGAVLHLDTAIKHISGLSSDSLNAHDIKNQVDQALYGLVQKRLDNALGSRQEATFVENTSEELHRRLGIEQFSHASYIKPALGKYFHDQFVQHLQSEIEKDRDIERKPFIEDFLHKFALKFRLSKAYIHVFKLINQINRYFPTYDFHTTNARKSRSQINEEFLQPAARKMSAAYEDGNRKLKNCQKGKFDAGQIAEDAWADIMREHFGEKFNVYQNKPINFDGKNSPEFDIILTKKDFFHKTPANLNTINPDDVVAAFEVKRTLLKRHVTLGTTQAKEIFDERCMSLKAAVMPKNRSMDRTLTPYQMVRGKIYFGLLSLEVDKAATDALFDGNNHAVRHPSYNPLNNDGPVFQFADYTADIIYCPGKLLWAKESKLIPGYLDKQLDIYWVQRGCNSIDPSCASLGYFIASMRRFFVAQGHIAKAEQPEALRPYQHFHFLPSANSFARVFIWEVGNNIPEHVRELYRYLRTDIPNEYSNAHLEYRAPLSVMKGWSAEAAQDISGYVKNDLKRIVKLELQRNYQPLPRGVSVDDASFDTYYNSLLSN
jgi:hypothetical protein